MSARQAKTTFLAGARAALLVILLAAALVAAPGAVRAGDPAAFVDSGQDLGRYDSYDFAMGDVDGDGDLDAFVANRVHPNSVWLNQGGAQGGVEGVFQRSEQESDTSSSHGVALGDLDGDGDLDAFVANYDRDEYHARLPGGPQPNQVWINQGRAQGGLEGVFLDSGQALGSPPRASMGVALGDLDGDGDLDAFVTNVYAQPNRVYVNQGGAQGGVEGLFADSAQQLGTSYSVNVALGDLDGDGDLDAYVVNREQPNRVYLNQGDGVFVDSGQALGNSKSYGVALGDVDGDGDLDAYVANTGPEGCPNVLWLNRGGEPGHVEGEFAMAQRMGGGRSNAVALGDLDFDGDLDVFVANYRGPNRVWINQGGDQGGVQGVFADSGQELEKPFQNVSWGVALGDLDGDGDLDAYVANRGNPNRVWLNQADPQTATFEARVTRPVDDAEERHTGAMVRGSADLELVYDGGGNQWVGLRFLGVAIPPGAVIVEAYVQFQQREYSALPTLLRIEGHDANYAAYLSMTPWDLSSRPKTDASVLWAPPPWPVAGRAGPDERTPDLSPIVQEIVGRAGWRSGNPIVLLFSGTGERVAESYNGNPDAAPLLHVAYRVD